MAVIVIIVKTEIILRETSLSVHANIKTGINIFISPKCSLCFQTLYHDSDDTLRVPIRLSTLCLLHSSSSLTTLVDVGVVP